MAPGKRDGNPRLTERRDRAIAVFDSGIGGLTVFRAIRKRLPNEDIVYLGDTARVPYGTKSRELILRYSEENAFFLRRFKPKVLVVACNTASAVALGHLRGRMDLPVYGVVEPGAREAAGRTHTGVIGVVATQTTIASRAYQQAIKRFGRKLRIVTRACPALVPLVEEGRTSTDALVRLALAEYLAGFAKASVDTLLLACTHYPVIRRAFTAAMGRRVSVVDCASETAAHLADDLDQLELLSGRRRAGKSHFLATDNAAHFARVGSRFLGTRLKNVIHIAPEEFYYPPRRRLG